MRLARQVRGHRQGSRGNRAKSAAISSSVRLNFIALARAASPLPPVLCLRRSGSLPLEIGNRVGSATSERDDVILDVAGAWTGRAARRWAGMLPLKLVLNFQ